MRSKSSIFWRLIAALPIILPVGLAAFSLVVVLLLVTVGIKNSLVWPIGGLLALGAMAVVWRKAFNRALTITREQKVADSLVLAGVVIWVVIGMFFTAQSVFVTRDPGIYTVTGKWLITHNKTDIKTPPIVIKENGLANYSSGIWLTTTSDKTILQPQGMHLLPGLLGLAGRVAGQTALFKTNVLLGGIALLSLYGFARRLTKPRWAILATTVMAVSLPMLYFSRDTYTEIISLTFTFGALSTLWLAQGRDRKTNSLGLWSVAGLMAGAGALARPDAYLTVVAIAIYLIIALALAPKKQQKTRLISGLFFLAASSLPMLAAWLDLTRLTDSYYINTGREVKIQLGLLMLTLVVGAVLVSASWRTKLLRRLDKLTKNWRGYAAGTLVVLGFLLLMLRPIILYSIHHGSNNTGALYGYSVRDQTNINTSPALVNDHTMDWIAWYVGLPMLIFGAIGLAVASAKTMRDRTAKLLPAILVVGSAILMYGLRPRITQDQIWAIRRFLPVILPGIVVFGVYGLSQVIEALNLESKIKNTVVALAAVVVIMLPLSTSRPFLFVTEKGNNLKTINALCQAIPKNAQVLWLGSSLELDAVQSTRAFCGNYTLGYTYRSRPGFKQDGLIDRVDLKNIAAINSRVARPTVLAIRTNRAEDLAPADRQQFTKIISYTQDQLEISYYNAPQQTIRVNDGFELAILDSQGRLKPLTVN